MEKMVPRMLGVLLCTLFVGADVTPVADFDLAKMAGKWYIVGFATNSAWFVNHKANMKIGTSTVTQTENGDIDLAYANLNSDGSCWRMNNLAKKTETPGRFTFHNEIWGNDNDMRIVEVVYDNYALVHTIKTKNGVSEVLDQLYSRTSESSEELQQKFRQFATGNGVLADNTVILPSNGECPSV